MERNGQPGETGEDLEWGRGPFFGALVVLAILCIIGLGSIHWVNLIDETHLVAFPREAPVGAASVMHLTEADFRDHPALGALILDKKRVLVSKGPLFDALLWLDPRSSYSPFGKEHEIFSSLRISTDEMRRILAKYALCEWNGTVYGVAQSA